ncbi:MAG: CoA transferase subunit A [Desulfobacteraceae bacterium]|nr:CoA transferase subunit A [Desulfobacteraceae bacterium]
MNPKNRKIMSLDHAISRFVHDGCHLSIGGFTVNRNPMAAVYEIIRQKKRGIHLYAHSNGQGVDELIGGGCVDRLEIAYAGNGRFAPTCVRFRKAVESGELVVEDYSNFQMSLRFTAGAMGLPFLPVKSGIESDIANQWGFKPAARRSDEKIPDLKLCIIDNPFGRWADTTRLVLVPAIEPDVSIIHAQTADSSGTVRIDGLAFTDIEQAKAARHVIVTCETIVDTRQLRKQPERNQLPFFCVDAVVHLPMGAYPTACYGHYDYDPGYLNDYRNYAQNDEHHRNYLDRYIFKTKDHAAFISLQPLHRLNKIKADPDTGYATGLNRL